MADLTDKEIKKLVDSVDWEALGKCINNLFNTVASIVKETSEVVSDLIKKGVLDMGGYEYSFKQTKKSVPNGWPLFEVYKSGELVAETDVINFDGNGLGWVKLDIRDGRIAIVNNVEFDGTTFRLIKKEEVK